MEKFPEKNLKRFERLLQSQDWIQSFGRKKSKTSAKDSSYIFLKTFLVSKYLTFLHVLSWIFQGKARWWGCEDQVSGTVHTRLPTCHLICQLCIKFALWFGPLPPLYETKYQGNKLASSKSYFWLVQLITLRLWNNWPGGYTKMSTTISGSENTVEQLLWNYLSPFALCVFVVVGRGWNWCCQGMIYRRSLLSPNAFQKPKLLLFLYPFLVEEKYVSADHRCLVYMHNLGRTRLIVLTQYG